jgi:hypothetical protein
VRFRVKSPARAGPCLKGMALKACLEKDHVLKLPHRSAILCERNAYESEKTMPGGVS